MSFARIFLMGDPIPRRDEKRKGLRRFGNALGPVFSKEGFKPF
jgi:hypothetical protein